MSTSLKCFITKLGMIFLLAAVFLITSVVVSQPVSYSYRTFNQYDFSLKKTNAGKAYQSVVTFKFYNKTGQDVNGLHAKFNNTIISINDAGGFTNSQILPKGKEVEFTGRVVSNGDSVSITVVSAKKAPGTKVSNWIWKFDGQQVDQKNTDLFGIKDVLLRTQPNGGNVLEFIYKRIVTRPAGVFVGIPTDTPAIGWIRYMKSDRGYFPHTGTARCFNGIMKGSGMVGPVKKELKNPKVKKHDNLLLGELHILKLAIIANDAGLTEPFDTNATLFGDLLYRDTLNSADPFNDLTLREVAHLADSAFTYCSHFSPELYSAITSGLMRINTAFNGTYQALSFEPFLLAGAQELGTVYFLHENPGTRAFQRTQNTFGLIDELPTQVSLRSNYPNPFNPTTTIAFSLPNQSFVTLRIYNVIGQEIANVLNHVSLDDGEQEVDFNAGNLSSGIYIYRLTVEDTETGHISSLVDRMMLVK